MLKEAFFLAHCCGRVLTLWTWLYTPCALVAQASVALSWWANGNQCVLSQLELWWFGTTFQGKPHAFVSKWRRWELYTHFCVGCWYWFGPALLGPALVLR